MMIYSNNMIACQHTSNVISNPNKARSRGCSCLMELSAQSRCIIGPGQFLTGGKPTERRGGRGVVPLQDLSPSTASLPLQRTSLEAGFQGGALCSSVRTQ